MNDHLHHHPEDTPSFGFLTTVAFTLNYIIGTGFLTLPWGFQQTGTPLGIILLGSLTVFAISAALCLLEAIARAEAYATSTNNFGSIAGDLGSYRAVGLRIRAESDKFLSMKVIANKKHAQVVSHGYNGDIRHNGNINNPQIDNDYSTEHYSDTALSNVVSSSTINRELQQATAEALAVGSEQFEVIELCKIFLGKQVARLYTLIMAVYMYCSLWAYSTVFANSLSARLPVMSFFSDGKDGYSTVTAAEDGGLSFSVYLLVFAMITVPTSMLELSEQVFVQVALSICRVMMLLVMIVTIVLAPIQQQYTTTVLGGDTTQIFGPLTPPLKPLSPQPSVATWSSLESFHLNKIYLMLPMAGFAFIFHHSIPAISHPVKNKNALGWIYTTALLVCFVGYTLLACTVSLYFGENTKISSNLNWEYYWGVIGPNREIPMYARCVSSFVVLLPAFDVASAFPLNAITLGNSLMSWYLGSRIHTLGTAEHRRSLAFFRLAAAVPPIVAAFCVSSLGMITNFAGVTGFAIAFLFPALLALYSKKLLKSHDVPHDTVYSCCLTSNWMCHLSIAMGLFLIVFVVLSLVVMGPPPS